MRRRSCRRNFRFRSGSSDGKSENGINRGSVKVLRIYRHGGFITTRDDNKVHSALDGQLKLYANGGGSTLVRHASLPERATMKEKCLLVCAFLGRAPSPRHLVDLIAEAMGFPCRLHATPMMRGRLTSTKGP